MILNRRLLSGLLLQSCYLQTVQVDMGTKQKFIRYKDKSEYLIVQKLSNIHCSLIASLYRNITAFKFKILHH